jgi:hypothetical protein
LIFKVIKYSADLKGRWDDFVNLSKNGTFLLFRDYMDYHADRFKDCSFMVLKKDELVAVLPGNVNKNIFYSHQGLTYGGLLLSGNLGIKSVLTIFNLINSNLKESGINEVIYKPIPYIYHVMPSQEDIYALFKLGAIKTGCNISSALWLFNQPGFNESRNGGIRKSKKAGINIIESTDYDIFWELLSSNLQKFYKVKPVHTLNEILYLRSKFPENIKLYVANFCEEIVAGTVIYKMNKAVHVQYISANETGRKTGALDLLFYELVYKVFANVSFFDFGSSTEKMGNYLNEKLIFQKEGFGGRGVVYETYKYFI